MRICPDCKHENPDTAALCENCGQVIYKAEQRQKDEQNALRSADDTHELAQELSLVIYVQGVQDPIVLYRMKNQITLGRMDPKSSRMPDVDLNPFGARDKGVSRIHAAIQYGEGTLTLTDLGSSNGTFLNGHRLNSNESRVLLNGDEIRLGVLVAYCFFK